MIAKNENSLILCTHMPLTLSSFSVSWILHLASRVVFRKIYVLWTNSSTIREAMAHNAHVRRCVVLKRHPSRGIEFQIGCRAAVCFLLARIPPGSFARVRPGHARFGAKRGVWCSFFGTVKEKEKVALNVNCINSVVYRTCMSNTFIYGPEISSTTFFSKLEHSWGKVDHSWVKVDHSWGKDIAASSKF